MSDAKLDTLELQVRVVADKLTAPGSSDTDHAIGMLLGMQVPIIRQNRENGLPSGLLPIRIRAVLRTQLARLDLMG